MVRIVLGSDLAPERAADPALAQLLTQGRGSLAFLIGNPACRYRLLGGAIHWDRVLLAFEGEQALGFAALKHDGRGPFALHWRPFIREFGLISGWVRFAGFCLSELREWRYPFLLYGLRVSKAARQQGMGAALVQACCTHAAKLGFTQVELEVPLNNPRAKRLYLHNGFALRRKRWVPFPPVRGMWRGVP
ncbi:MULTISPECIES: GNAT family N-acetyltransferase [unclassified Pseudomonas]|uniref:GNAT family N-acetyltransferase n=1 Tax=unclassified Pseudomonas TaxID=196821 RepID=UPI000A0DFB24|nr:GNAT family N-acetyltransferase [Pseudomonas sp. ITEM 17296]SMF45967.1 Acetyltransferases [Pseudomonas sp. LAIL14HWK12:I11]SMR79609.1 Acetyltransferases [Pseudomonas sp. LAIL14HWK12:I10]SOD05694.1 Acetyltransferases [Pseudomonas sp. LAIL14HWK12:I8]